MERRNEITNHQRIIYNRTLLFYYTYHSFGICDLYLPMLDDDDDAFMDDTYHYSRRGCDGRLILFILMLVYYVSFVVII